MQKKSRQRLKTIKNRVTIFFLGLGIAALVAFMIIGFIHKDKVGQRYHSIPHMEKIDSDKLNSDDTKKEL